MSEELLTTKQDDDLLIVGRKGQYLAVKGPEDPRHAQVCQITDICNGVLSLKFDDPQLRRASSRGCDNFEPARPGQISQIRQT